MGAPRLDQRAEGARGAAPAVYDFLDYRAFLRAHYRHAKQASRGFSFRRLARRSGLKSHSLIKMVIEGQRTLSEPHAEALAQGCGLGRDEAGYFVALVAWNQAQRLDERRRTWAEVLHRRPRSAAHRLRTHELEVLADPKAALLLELVRVEGFQSDGAWISARTRGQIAPAEAEALLDRLVEVGLLAREAARLRPTQATVVAGGDIPNALIQMYHQSVAAAGSEALSQVEVNRREFSATTIAVRKEQLPELKEEVRRLQRRLLELAETVETPDTVMQVNVQLFPWD